MSYEVQVSVLGGLLVDVEFETAPAEPERWYYVRIRRKLANCRHQRQSQEDTDWILKRLSRREQKLLLRKLAKTPLAAGNGKGPRNETLSHRRLRRMNPLMVETRSVDTGERLANGSLTIRAIRIGLGLAANLWAFRNGHGVVTRPLQRFASKPRKLGRIPKSWALCRMKSPICSATVKNRIGVGVMPKNSADRPSPPWLNCWHLTPLSTRRLAAWSSRRR